MLLGFKVQEIKITPIGVSLEFSTLCEAYNQKVKKGNVLSLKRAVVALSGPITNFIITTILFLAMTLKPEWSIISILQLIIYSNFLIGIFNLIPIYPLDGGRVLKEILHIIFGLKKAERITHYISIATVIFLTIIASIIILYIQNIAVLVIITYLWGDVIIETKRYYARRRIQETIQKCLLNKENCDKIVTLKK